jgi:paraquat-inducible protein A
MSDDKNLQPIMVACPDCDLLNQVPELVPGESASCVRCDATLSRNPKNSIARALALTWTAVILFIVANSFPFLSFGMEGIVAHTTLISGVESLYREGMIFVAAAVGFTTFVVPTVILSGLLYLLLPLQVGRRLPGAERILRLMLSLKPWNMVEIFMIGIIVAGVKLHKMADLVPGLSAWAFILLIFVFAAIYVCLESRLLWERMEAAR